MNTYSYGYTDRCSITVIIIAYAGILSKRSNIRNNRQLEHNVGKLFF